LTVPIPWPSIEAGLRGGQVGFTSRIRLNLITEKGYCVKLAMKELLRTNDAVLLSFATTLLREEGIEPTVLDTHTSILEGSIAAIPRRLMVADSDHARARGLLDEALSRVSATRARSDGQDRR
jgi:hypothetical protein